MNNNDFASTPLITPDRLRTERPEDIFHVTPAWARYVELVRPNEGIPAEDATFYAAVQGAKGAHSDGFFDAAFVAILFELTRYPGISMRANIREAGDPRQYTKLIFTSAPPDNFPINRLTMDAVVGEQVEFVEGRTDHRYENLKRVPGRSKKDAREIARGHAEEAARNAGLSGKALEGYLDNLSALFANHDDLQRAAE